jgi:mannosylglucosylglycerate synthase
VSFRLGGIDGVSRESDKYDIALRALGWKVVTVAGEGPVDRLVPGLAIDAPAPPRSHEVEDALADVDVALVMNLCSLPLNPAAAGVVAAVLRGRPAVLVHFDLPWQRARFATMAPPPDDAAWAHVAINRRSAQELAEHGIASTTIYNTFDLDGATVPKAEARRLLELDSNRQVVLQPTRAIERKNVPAGLQLAESLNAVYWLTGPAEEGYGPELESVLSRARVPVVRRSVDDMAVAYGACDLVAFPSTVEGFGNPVVESAVHRRPIAVGSYPVLDELREFGFEWLPAGSPDVVARALGDADRMADMLDRNHEVARLHFSSAALPERIGAVFESRGWGP